MKRGSVSRGALICRNHTEGGAVGQYTEEPTQYSMMKPGERYLVFAIDDDRPTIPEVPGAKRYLISGEGSEIFDSIRTTRFT